MQLSLFTWNGTAINDTTNYVAWIPQGQQFVPVGSPIYTKRYGTYPMLSGSVLNETYFTIEIEGKGTWHSQRQTLKRLFDTANQTPLVLIAKDGADSSRQWYIKAIPKQVVEGQSNVGHLTVTLATYEPYWRVVTPSTDSASITATGQQKTLAVIGSTYARPVITLTPTATKTDGYAYQRWVLIKNVIANSFVDYPIDITFGGWNTTTPVGAGHMQADGDDLRVVYDGVEAYRWFGGGGINSTTTTVWINIDLSPAANPILKGAHSNAVTTLQCKKTADNLEALTTLGAAPNKVVYIGTEAITYTGVDLVNYYITGCTRGQKATTAASHSDGDVVYWIEHDIWVTYGNSTETAPDVNDGYKPMLDLANSTNTLWKWTDYWISGTHRTAKWRPLRIAALGPTSDIYTANHQTNEDVSVPASEMGMSIASFVRSNVQKAETATLSWNLYCPAGMTTVNVTGEKYRGTAAWPALAGLQKSTDGVIWNTVWTEVTPASVTTWTAVANTGDKALTTTQYHLRFVLDGSVNAKAAAVADLEIDAVAVTLYSSGVPVGVFGAEQSNRYYLKATITNTTSGDYVSFQYPSYLNKALTLDCDNKKLTWFDGSVAPVDVVNVDKYNTDWLRLTPGNNVLQYDEVNVAGVTLAFSWEDREFL